MYAPEITLKIFSQHNQLCMIVSILVFFLSLVVMILFWFCCVHLLKKKLFLSMTNDNLFFPMKRIVIMLVIQVNFVTVAQP